MSYEKEIRRCNPGLVFLLIDDSLSMREFLAGTSEPRFKWTETYFGHITEEMVRRCTDMKGDELVIKPRYYLTIIKYGSTSELWGDPEMDIQQVAQLYTDSGNSLGLGGNFQGTNAKKAFEMVLRNLEQSLAKERFLDSFPPMVLHLTDGESQSDPRAIVENIKQLFTNDGNVLVANAYIGTQTSLNYNGPEDFPGYVDVSEAGPSEDNTRLFEMSSVAPECIVNNLKADGVFPNFRKGSRLFFDVRTNEMLKNVLQVIGSMGTETRGIS